jgi:hypothetical protein
MWRPSGITIYRDQFNRPKASVNSKGRTGVKGRLKFLSAGKRVQARMIAAWEKNKPYRDIYS